MVGTWDLVAQSPVELEEALGTSVAGTSPWGLAGDVVWERALRPHHVLLPRGLRRLGQSDEKIKLKKKKTAIISFLEVLPVLPVSPVLPASSGTTPQLSSSGGTQPSASPKFPDETQRGLRRTSKKKKKPLYLKKTPKNPKKTFFDAKADI